MTVPADPQRTPRRQGFARREDGSMTIMALLFFVCMVMIAGISVDIMVFENQRTRLQNLSDRATLAAADMQQDIDPQTVVEDYFAKAGMADHLDAVRVVDNPNERRVAAIASTVYNTMFMSMTGADTLTPRAFSEAVEGITDVEISLVLDVSGSMGWASSAPGSTSKMADLKKAAKRFIDTVYARDHQHRITTTIVPYSTQVNAGPLIFDAMSPTDEHDYSQCIEFEDADFASVTLDLSKAYQRAGHFDMWNASATPRRTVCRTETGMTITPFLSDTAKIKAAIDRLSASGQTSIETGLKWGAAFLDPSTRPMSAVLPNVRTQHSDRPFAYDRENTSKFVVLLTDGVNTTHKKLKAPYLDGPSDVWKYIPRWGEAREVVGPGWGVDPGDSIRHVVYSVARPENGDEDGDGIAGEGYWVDSMVTYNGVWIPERWIAEPFGTPVWDTPNPAPGPASPDRYNVWNLDWPEVWLEMPVQRYATRLVWDPRNSSSERNAFYRAAWSDVGGWKKDRRMRTLCGKLKDAKVTVYTIGFEVNDHAAGVMQNCASTANHFIRVVGDDLEDAFDAIASDISRLRLTQ
ncbi:hypothetical protein DXV76_12750 [Rhodobacteraceae bacterium CCMM004]|nr:hypothetical protein DXV76_12750 [Rhodobacteraceae bacterium CCMM004]